MSLRAVAGGIVGGSSSANANNGATISIFPQSTTGANALAENAIIDYGATAFTGNFYNDPVTCYGYNVNAQAGIADNTGIEKFAAGLFFEANFEPDTGQGGTCTAGTTTTLVTISGKTWETDRYINYTVYNVTRGLSQRATANTATTLTHAAIAGQTTGDVIQILRCDMETYLQWAMSAGAGYQSIRPLVFTFDRGRTQAQQAGLTVTAATNANPAVFTTSTNHGLAVDDYVGFRSFSGGTWGTQLTWRSRRVASVPSATTFTVDNVNSTGFGAFSAGTVYLMTNMNSEILCGPQTGLTIRAATFNRATQAPSGQTWVDDVLAVFQVGGVQFYPGGAINNSFTVNTGLGGFSQITLTNNQVVTANLVANAAATFSIQCFDSAGANVVRACGFFRNSGAWGGICVGENGGINNALLCADGTLLPTSTPMHRARQQATPTAAAHVFAVYANDNSTLQYFIDGVGNWVPRATATAVGNTNGYMYVSKVSGKPTGVPANLTGNYANAAPLVYDTTNKKLSVYDSTSAAWLQTAAMT